MPTGYGHLTLPSSGRSKGRFAPFGPPLMSNVRPHCMQIARHRICRRLRLNALRATEQYPRRLQLSSGSGKAARSVPAAKAEWRMAVRLVGRVYFRHPPVRAVRPSAARSPQLRLQWFKPGTPLRQSPCVGLALGSSVQAHSAHARARPFAPSSASIECVSRRWFGAQQSRGVV